MLNIRFVYIILFLQINLAFAQINNEVDSFNFSTLTSFDVFLHTTKNNLISYIGIPNSFTLNREVTCFGNRNVDKDYQYTINSLKYRDRGLIYWERENNVWLHCVSFSKKNDYTIEHPEILLNRYLKVDDFIKAFKVPEERIMSLTGRMVPFETSRNSSFTVIVFKIAGSICIETIEFYFDKKGFLKAIYFILLN